MKTHRGAPQYLFSRIYQLAIKPPTPGPALSFGNLHGEQSALRVAFQLDRKTASGPNKGNIAVFNLNQRARVAIGVGWQVALRAGYDGLNEIIFAGKVGTINTSRQGPDIVTSMECQEGFGQLVATPYSKSFPPGTHLADALSDVARTMQADAGIVRDLPDVTFERGVTLSGSCRDVLATLLTPVGLEASVQNGRLNIIPKDQPLGTAAIVIGQDSGLIGVPTLDKHNVTFEALLNPRLSPGQLVQLKTFNKAAAGFYKIREAKMEGDTHDQKWSVTCTCARLTGVIVQPQLAHGLNFASAIKGLL